MQVCLGCIYQALLLVWLCKYLPPIALQSVSAPELQRQRVMQEIGCMVLLQQHPHAVKLLEVYEDDKNYHLVMEFLKGRY